ncbi:MAG TPA: AraC family transcriptional regulator [Bryobacteraceae bacterium]|nr:AraC family transcriptional regulator [Bryobacteraceae bacterium]
MRSLNAKATNNAREIAALASHCDKIHFPNASIECRRALYSAASSTGRHYHDDAYLVFMLSGSLIQTMGSETTVLSPNSLMYVPAGEMHATTFGSHGARCFFVGIDAMWIQKKLDSATIDGSRPRITEGRSYLQPFGRKMYEEFRDPDSLSEMIVEGALLELFGRWFREQSLGHRWAPGWLRAVKIFLHDSFRDSISLADISRAVGVHPSQIAREFHRAHDVTVGEYIRRLRTDFVADKLRNAGKLPDLTDLALQAGFSSHSHMSAVFKQRTGMTPSQYKKAHGIASIW